MREGFRREYTWRGKPPGEFAAHRGWTLCWEWARLSSGAFRVTITALNPRSPKPVFRDVLIGFSNSRFDPDEATRSLDAAEAEIRHHVDGIEDLEAAWAMKGD